ncbi:hypothetical protein VTN49DRAFT_3355 [Thermomyces lanuginosus]|uniref:uncharacterized protein n=1 Tax=Thermomyces lanuginosus TaxID=5541 RepID=UPI003742216C
MKRRATGRSEASDFQDLICGMILKQTRKTRARRMQGSVCMQVRTGFKNFRHKENNKHFTCKRMKQTMNTDNTRYAQSIYAEESKGSKS